MSKREVEVTHVNEFYCDKCDELCSPKKVIQCEKGHVSCNNCYIKFWIQSVLPNASTKPFDLCSLCECSVPGVKVAAIIPVKEQSLYYVQQLSSEENAFSCPTPGCKQITMYARLTGLHVCKCCNNSYCIRCRKKNGHPGEDCTPVVTATNIVAPDLKIRPEKKCSGCGKNIQRHRGCNHVRCKCGIHNCYTCGMQIDGENPMEHFRKCNNYRTKPGSESKCTIEGCHHCQKWPTEHVARHRYRVKDEVQKSNVKKRKLKLRRINEAILQKAKRIGAEMKEERARRIKQRWERGSPVEKT